MPKLPRVAAALLAATMTVAAATPGIAQGGPGNPRGPHAYPMHRGGPPAAVPPGRVKVFRGIRVIRPYGHWYAGYGRYRHDADAYRWLAFTAITLAILDTMNEAEQRALEQAQIQATTAPVQETITWNEGNAAGTVTAVREGTSSSGRYCREFQQTVTVGGRTEQAYGTACRQLDGAWEVVSTEG